MRLVAPVFLIAALAICALVATLIVRSMLDSTPKVEALHTQSKFRPPPGATLVDPGGREPVARSEKTIDEPVLDMDYDDSWVGNFPEFIGGYKVQYIETPKSVACSNQSVIHLVAQQKSMDEFLSTPLDIHSLRATIRSIEGVPPDGIVLGFSGILFSEKEIEEWDESIRRQTEDAKINGCVQFSPLEFSLPSTATDERLPDKLLEPPAQSQLDPDDTHPPRAWVGPNRQSGDGTTRISSLPA